MKFVVLDSKDRQHELVSRMAGVYPTERWYLDGQLLAVDDQYGWIYPDPYGKPKLVKDSILKNNIDEIVFGQVLPLGVDEEEE